MSLRTDPVEERCCHIRISKDLSPFTEAQVGRDDDAGALLEFAEEVEQQRPTRWAGRQISKLIKDE